MTEKDKQRITMEQFNDISKHVEKAKEMMENPILLENVYECLQNDATRCSEEEGENIADASWTFHTLSTFISTDFLSRLSPEKQNNINSYLKNQTLLENTYKFLQDHATQGSKEEGEDTINASWAFETLSSLTIVKDYLHEKGKKIDDETFAKEALNPTEKIPPRPETRNNY